MGFPSSKKIKTEDDEDEEEERHLNKKEGVELNMEEKEEEAKERVCSDFIKYPSRWYILAIYALFGNMQVSAFKQKLKVLTK